MVSYTAMDLNRQINNYNEKFDLNLNGKTIKECIKIIQDHCPQLHSTEQIQKYCKDNLNKIHEKYGYKALRIFYHSFIKQDLLKSYQGKDMLEIKYEKLIHEIKEYHNTLLNWITLQLDYYIYCTELEKIYKETYGVINDYENRLYSIIKTIHLSHYNKNIINSLSELLKEYLLISGDNYYITQDLKDKEVLNMLYEHITEEAYDETQYNALNNIFTSYDGYGNEYYNSDYQETWTDEKGYHCRSWNKPSTINDYIRRG